MIYFNQIVKKSKSIDFSKNMKSLCFKKHFCVTTLTANCLLLYVGKFGKNSIEEALKWCWGRISHQNGVLTTPWWACCLQFIILLCLFTQCSIVVWWAPLVRTATSADASARKSACALALKLTWRRDSCLVALQIFYEWANLNELNVSTRTFLQVTLFVRCVLTVFVIRQNNENWRWKMLTCAEFYVYLIIYVPSF